MQQDLDRLRRLREESANLLQRLQEAGKNKTPLALVDHAERVARRRHEDKRPWSSPRRGMRSYPGSPEKPALGDASKTPRSRKSSPGKKRQKAPAETPMPQFPFSPERYAQAIQADMARKIERNLNQSDEYYAQLQAFRALNTDIFTRPEEEYLSKLPRQAYSPLPARTPQPTQDPLYRHTGLFRVNSRLYPEPVDENESGPYTDKEGVRVSIPHSYLPPRDASTKKVFIPIGLTVNVSLKLAPGRSFAQGLLGMEPGVSPFWKVD
ncbi:MAG: hypothetical protein SGCHY_000776 [Lobulomycetales sp.]